jgi:hypothetical protein
MYDYIVKLFFEMEDLPVGNTLQRNLMLAPEHTVIMEMLLSPIMLHPLDPVWLYKAALLVSQFPQLWAS